MRSCEGRRAGSFGRPALAGEKLRRRPGAWQADRAPIDAREELGGGFEEETFGLRNGHTARIVRALTPWRLDLEERCAIVSDGEGPVLPAGSEVELDAGDLSVPLDRTAAMERIETKPGS